MCWLHGVVPAVYSDLDAWQLLDGSDIPCLEADVKAGEALYLPRAWWHAVWPPNSNLANLVICGLSLNKNQHFVS